MREAAKKLFLGLSMAVVAAVVTARALEQVRRPGALTARGETRWFGWAYRDPPLLARLEGAERLLHPGEAFCLESSTTRVDSGWLRAMASYAFWRELPTGPCPAGPDATAPIMSPIAHIVVSETAVTVRRIVR